VTKNRDREQGDPREAPAYGLPEAAHYLDLPVATLRSWVLGRPYETRLGPQIWKAVVVPPEANLRQLSFINLIEAHVLAAIRRIHGVQFAKIRSALEYVLQEIPSAHPLAERDFETNGKDLFIERYGKLVNASQQGQQAIREVLADFLTRIDRDPEGVAARLYPFTRRGRPTAELRTAPRLVVIDPRVSFGRPVLKGTGIQTSVVLNRFLAGDSPEELAEDYGRPRGEIDEAIRWEIHPKAA